MFLRAALAALYLLSAALSAPAQQIRNLPPVGQPLSTNDLMVVEQLLAAGNRWQTSQTTVGALQSFFSYFTQSGTTLSYPGCLTIPSTVTGGCKGAGTINAAGLYVNGSAFSVLTRPIAVVTEYFVRTDGNDTLCNGLYDAAYTSNANCSFATWQNSVNVAAAFDFKGQFIYIQHGTEVGAKTFTVGATIPSLVGGGILFISGSATPGDTIVSAASGDAFDLESVGSTVVFFQQITLESATLNDLQASYNSRLEVGNAVVFGPAAISHIFVHDNQAEAIILNATYSITGSAPNHIIAVNGGHIFLENSAVTLTGTPAFSGGFAAAQSNGSIQAGAGTTFTGAATGLRFAASIGGSINSLGNGINFFPGNLAGNTSNGGHYDAIDDSAWNSQSTTVAPQFNSFTTASATVAWNLPGGTLSQTANVNISVVISNVGTASGAALVVMPFSAQNRTCYLVGIDETAGTALLGTIAPGSATAIINTISNTGAIVGNSIGLNVNGTCQIAP